MNWLKIIIFKKKANVADETEKAIEPAPTEAPNVADETEKTFEPAPVVETQTNGTSNEKKTEAPDVVSNVYEKAETTLKPIEAALGTEESQKDGTSEEKKTEAKESAEEKANVWWGSSSKTNIRQEVMHLLLFIRQGRMPMMWL